MEENKILGIPSLTVEDLNKLAELKIDDQNLKRKIELMTYTAYYEMHEMDQDRSSFFLWILLAENIDSHYRK